MSFSIKKKSFYKLDTLTLSLNGTDVVPVSKIGIAWTTDKDVKFNNPTSDPVSCKY